MGAMSFVICGNAWACLLCNSLLSISKYNKCIWHCFIALLDELHISILGGVADLIFVFFDPIGLALCERTMVVVKKINSLYPEKLHFYLSKSDEIRKQTDKEKWVETFFSFI